MKLKNKLLPLVGVAAVCATAAPIALTSCKTNNDWIDLMEKYNPTVKALDNQTLTTEKANEAYFGKEGSWKSDDEVIKTFKDDYLWSTYQYGDVSSGEFTEAKIKFDNFSVAHPKFTSIIPTVDPYEVPTFTYKAEFVGSYVYSGTSQEISMQYSIVDTLVNVPFTVSYSSNIPYAKLDDPLWMVLPSTSIIGQNEMSRSLVWTAKEEITFTYTVRSSETGYEDTQTNTATTMAYSGAGESLIYQFFLASKMSAPKYAFSHYLFSVQNGDPIGPK